MGCLSVGFYQWDVCRRVFMNGKFVNGFIDVFISDSRLH